MSTAALATLLEDDAVPMAALHQRYGSLLELVRVLIGVVPNCDPYLEIWPPAFVTYNIMVPNFLNLPFSLVGLGGPPVATVGLGMYVASRTAECPYCAAHCCSFALRRGADREKLAKALFPDDESHSSLERATIAVARSIAAVPCSLVDSERVALERELSKEHAEWIIAGIVMMGFLNKFMDAIGVDLESSTHSEVVEIMGTSWSPGIAGRKLDPEGKPTPPPRSDTIGTRLRIVPHLPRALRLDRKWQRGTPDAWPELGTFLKERTGHDFPVVGRLHHARFARTVASMIATNMDPATTTIGIATKCVIALVFAAVVGDLALEAEVRKLGGHAGVSSDLLTAARRFAKEGGNAPGDDARTRALVALARAASPSPAAVDDDAVAACRDAKLKAAEIVELVTWVAVLQMLHRLEAWYGAE